MGLLSTIGNIGGAIANTVGSALSGNWAGAASHLASGLSSIGASHDSNKLNDKSMAFQREMLASQQKFNAEQSALQNDWSANQARLARNWQEKMVAQENEFNSPKEQIKRMAEAGLNPNLLSGSVAESGTVSSVPTPSGSPAQGGLPGVPSLSNPVLDSAQARLADAQARNLDAKTETEEETRKTNVRQGQLNLELGELGKKLSQAQYDNLVAKTKEVDQAVKESEQRIAQSKAYVDLMDKDGQLKQKEIEHYEERIVAELDELESRTNLNIANKKAVGSQIMRNVAEARLANANARLADVNAQVQNDVHILNGVEIQYQTKYGPVLAQYRWNAERQEYNATIARSKDEATESRIKEEKARSRRENDWVGERIWNYGLDRTEELAGALGNIFGASANVSATSGATKVMKVVK